MEKRYIILYIFAKKSIFDVKKKIPIGLFYVGPIYVNTVQYLYRFFQRRFIMVKSSHVARFPSMFVVANFPTNLVVEYFT